MSDQSSPTHSTGVASPDDSPDFGSPGRSADPKRRPQVDAGGGRGTLSIADGVVAKIAGIACREVSGVYNMGTGASRLFGAVKEHLPGTPTTPDAAQGVSVEVGEIETAIDLDVVTQYGAAIPDVARAIRENVIRRVESMTGLSVTEVNVSVDDVYLGDELSEHEEPRVQ